MGVAIRLAGCVLVGLGLSTAATPAAAQQTTRSALSGVYTAQQAQQGETLFKGICANCHTNSQFTGAQFQKSWAGRAVFSLFDQLRTTMPMDNPGGLSRAEYLAVISYILKLNAYPAGTAELPDDDAALKLIRFDTAAGASSSGRAASGRLRSGAESLPRRTGSAQR